MKRWTWRLYAVVFTFLNFIHAYIFLSPDSSALAYYHMMIGFNRTYLIIYFLNIACIYVGLAACIPLLSYAFSIKNTAVVLWQTLFYARIFFDLFGHHYDFKFIQSAFAQGPQLGAIALIAWLLPLLPSYVAHYLYAFRQKDK